MQIYFIRHAHALSRNEWEDYDIFRPLSEKGVERAEKAFSRFCELFKKPDVIITSEASRALKTAEIMSKHTGSGILKEPLLNPGAEILDYESVIKTYDTDPEQTIALIGHEPDLSKFISFYISEGELYLIMKKGSICYVDNNALKALIQQKYLL